MHHNILQYENFKYEVLFIMRVAKDNNVPKLLMLFKINIRWHKGNLKVKMEEKSMHN